MANFKRGRPKHRRGGCLLCKPHKHERAAKKDAKGRSLKWQAGPLALD